MEDNANNCQGCGAQFNSQDELKQHNQQVHGSENGEMPQQPTDDTGDMGSQDEGDDNEANRM